MASVQEEMGPIDILINNAGVLSNHKVLETPPEEWRRVLQVNLDGAFYLSKAVIPGMRGKKWGRINQCELFRRQVWRHYGRHCLLRFQGGVDLAHLLACRGNGSRRDHGECNRAGIRQTPMVTHQLTEQQRAAVIARIPVRRYCEPEEFAHVVQFLASPLAGFITGEVIDQNGGLQFD